MVNTGFVALLISLILVFTSVNTKADIQAQLSATQLQEGDTVVLTLSDTDNSGGQPDLSPLEKDFQILGTQSSQRTSIINGKRSHLTQWVVTLYPKNTGKITVPSLSQGRYQTQAIPLTVADAPQNQDIPTAQSPVIQAELDKDSVYLHGQALLTVRIMHLGNLADYNLSEVTLEGADVEPIFDRNYQRVIQNRPVAVYEHIFAIHADTVGTIDIPGILLKAEMAVGNQRSIFGSLQTKTVMRKGPPLSLKVNELPQFVQGKDAITATDFTIEENWSEPLSNLKVGDSLTRSLVFTAVGARGASIPPIFSQDIDGIKQYPDQPTIEDSLQQSGIIGIRKESTAYVLTRAGVYDIPAIQLYWVDANSGKVKTASLPSTRLTVSDSNPASDTPTQADSSLATNVDNGEQYAPATTTNITVAPYSSVWFWLSLIFLCLWLITLALYLSSVGKKQATNPSKTTNNDDSLQTKLFVNLLQECKKSDPKAALTAFNRWGQSLDKSLVSNAQICRFLNDDEITKSINRADRHCFETNSSQAWHGAQLAEHLKLWQKKSSKNTGKKLPDLYT